VQLGTEENPYGRVRVVAPGYFAVLGIPILAGRDFTDADRDDSETVAIVSDSIAKRLFPNGGVLNRNLWWTKPGPPFCQPCRIVGVVADVDDENVVPGPSFAIYHPLRQARLAGRMFVHTAGDPYTLVPSVTQTVREMAANQPVDRAATLNDVRAEVLAPDRLKALAVSGFAGVALLIAAVGVSGVLAFSVSARTREFGVRLALGATPKHLLLRVLRDAALIVASGIAVGAVSGYIAIRVANASFEHVHPPAMLPLLGAAIVLATAGILASVIPAIRASRVDVLQALRSE
jgi:putative ABC transport system permease protein